MKESLRLASLTVTNRPAHSPLLLASNEQQLNLVQDLTVGGKESDQDD